MAINWLKLLDGSDEGAQSTAQGSTAQLTWGCQGSDDIAEMYPLVAAQVPATYNDGLKTLIFRTLERRQLERRYWEWTAHYVDPDREKEDTPAAGSVTWDYDTTGGTLKILYSRQTVQAYGANPPDFKNAIEVEKDEVRGADIVIPAVKFTAHYRRPAVAPDPIARGAALADLTGTTNDALFYGRAIGTMLYMGVRGGVSLANGLQEDHEFIYSKNAVNLTVGPLNGIDKKGHEYLWICFEPAVDGAANRLARQPKWVYVERLYEAADFSQIGIGVAP